MATLQATNIADLVATTLNSLGRLKFTDLMSDYQNTLALKRLLKKSKMTFDNGPEASFNLITGTNQSARWTGLYEQDVVDNVNVMTTGKVGWRHCTWNWSVDFREPIMNSGDAKIVDLVKTKRIAAFGDAIKLFENAFWRVPAVTDLTTMFGLPYYIVKSSTAVTTNDGFNGDVPSGYSLVANVSTTTYRRWKNYATTYTTVSKDDLIRKLRRMSVYTDFAPLVDDVPDYDQGREMAYYTNYTVLGTMEEILESQNENLGSDVAPMDGKVKFRRADVVFAKELDLDTTNPVYSVNWGVLHAMGLKGCWMKETPVAQQPGQHTVSATHTDCTANLICHDRRKLGVLATATTMGY